MKCLTLRELCEACGVTRRAIQGYEGFGLIESCDRNDRGHLLYDELVIEMVKEIRMLQNFGFSLKEIVHYKNQDSKLTKKMLIEKLKGLKEKRELLEGSISQIEKLIAEKSD